MEFKLNVWLPFCNRKQRPADKLRNAFTVKCRWSLHFEPLQHLTRNSKTN